MANENKCTSSSSSLSTIENTNVEVTIAFVFVLACRLRAPSNRLSESVSLELLAFFLTSLLACAQFESHCNGYSLNFNPKLMVWTNLLWPPKICSQQRALSLAPIETSFSSRSFHVIFDHFSESLMQVNLLWLLFSLYLSFFIFFQLLP